jgi:hypothetical protein
VIDQKHNNVVASVFEHPSDWKAQSEVIWNFQNMAMPAIARASVFNPAAKILHELKAQFDQYIAAGYSQIQVAGQLSSAISANNDALLSSFAQQRLAAGHRDSGRSSSNEAFSDYIRGVGTVQDPYYGESKQDANYQYHWTDGSGSYRHSNDPFFNPNIGSTGDWTLMQKKG